VYRTSEIKMKTEEKIYSDQKSPNIGPDVKKWEKDQKDSKSKVEKDPEGTVEKTTKSLVEKGKEGPVTKVMATVPNQVHYKGSLYTIAEKQPGGFPGPNEGYKDEKAPASALSDWQKKQDKPNLDNSVKWSQNYEKTTDLIDEEAKKFAKYIKHNGSLYVMAEEAKEKEYSDAAVMAADFGIPPEDLEDLKKYKDDSGVSIFDLASLAHSYNKKKASSKRYAVKDEDIYNLDEWEDEQYDFLIIASFDGEASWEVVDGAHSASEADELLSEYMMAYGPSTPIKIHSMRRHYNNDRYPTEYDASVRKKRVTAVAKEYAEVIKGVKDSLVALPLEWIGKDNSKRLLMHVHVPVSKGTSTFNKIRKAIKSGIVVPEGQKVQDHGTDGNFKEDEYSSAVFAIGKLEFHVSLELDEDREQGTKKADIGVFTYIRK